MKIDIFFSLFSFELNTYFGFLSDANQSMHKKQDDDDHGWRWWHDMTQKMTTLDNKIYTYMYGGT